MYSPDFFRVENQTAIHALIDESPFAILLSEKTPDLVSHLPFIFNSERTTLVGHMTRANPQWKTLTEEGRAKLIFNGPHTYISPGWYLEKPGNVPTWNYAVVHVKGDLKIISKPEDALETLKRMTSRFESKYGTGWNIQDDAQTHALLNAIVVMELTGLEFEAKFKLSQQQSEENRQRVIAALGTSADFDARKIAEMMRTASVK